MASVVTVLSINGNLMRAGEVEPCDGLWPGEASVMEISDCGTASTDAALPQGIGWLMTTDGCSELDSMT